MPDCRRLVVVVAHPHEELCAAGGLLHDLVLQGVPVSVLAVTDTGAPTSAYRLPLVRYPIAAAQRIRSSTPADHEVHQLALTAPVRRRKRRALMRLRVGGLAGDVEQVAPTEVFVGDLVSRPGAATAESAAWPR